MPQPSKIELSNYAAKRRWQLAAGRSAGSSRCQRWQLVDGVSGTLFSEALTTEGAIVFAKACAFGLEGIVSKRAGSSYKSGKSRNWLKMIRT